MELSFDELRLPRQRRRFGCSRVHTRSTEIRICKAIIGPCHRSPPKSQQDHRSPGPWISVGLDFRTHLAHVLALLALHCTSLHFPFHLPVLALPCYPRLLSYFPALLVLPCTPCTSLSTLALPAHFERVWLGAASPDLDVASDLERRIPDVPAAGIGVACRLNQQ